MHKSKRSVCSRILSSDIRSLFVINKLINLFCLGFRPDEGGHVVTADCIVGSLHGSRTPWSVRRQKKWSTESFTILGPSGPRRKKQEVWPIESLTISLRRYACLCSPISAFEMRFLYIIMKPISLKVPFSAEATKHFCSSSRVTLSQIGEIYPRAHSKFGSSLLRIR